MIGHARKGVKAAGVPKPKFKPRKDKPMSSKPKDDKPKQEELIPKEKEKTEEKHDPVEAEPGAAVVKPSELGKKREQELADAQPEAIAKKQKAEEGEITAFPGAKPEKPPGKDKK